MDAAQGQPDQVIVRQLGKGGHAIVYEARVRGQRVALKRPRPERLQRRPRVREDFEREFYTLSQLAHPNIIEVYDYGVDDDGPYYTMELLDGGSLQERVPMGWEEACRILRDVAAALALVQSRRLVHRDVTLHNVRLTGAGVTKLIDFGAMTPIGIPNKTVGTPAYMAPEAVHRQALDPRTDLYSLGALGYRLLSGRDAYPARKLDELRDIWRTRPRPLRDLFPGIPSQLDALIRQLLSFNPEARCRTPAEVIMRLGAIAGLSDLDEGAIGRAYLTTPSLVGRDAQLQAIRRRLVGASCGEGTAMLVEGVAGAGRSRLLDACVLDGQLAGMTVLRACASDGPLAPFDLVAKLVVELSRVWPGSLNDNLARLLIRHNSKAPKPPWASGGSNTEASEAEAALWQDGAVAGFLEAAGSAPLLLVIDDLHEADPGSAAVITYLAEFGSRRPIAIVASTLADAPANTRQALKLLRRRAQHLTLPPLDADQTLAVVRSLFGDEVNVQLVASRIHDVAAGNPRAIVDLAEWLVSESLVAHQGGRWHIPSTITALPLPTSVDDALRQRLARLGPRARQLALALAVAGDAELPYAQYGHILGIEEGPHVHDAVSELVGMQVVARRGNGYGLSQAGLRDLLVELTDRPTLAIVHRRIAATCDETDQPDWAIYHRFYGGAQDEAVLQLVKRLRSDYAPSLILRTPDARVAYLRDVLEHARSMDVPACDLFQLKNQVVRRAEIKASLVREELASLCADYRNLTGLEDWEALPADMDPLARINTALESAAVRYAGLPESQRVLAPKDAMASMLGFVTSCLAIALANCEVSLLARIPPLSPFSPISKRIAFVEVFTKAVKQTLRARGQAASRTFSQLIEKLDGPEGGALGSARQRLKRHALITLGFIHASMARSTALDYADALEEMVREYADPHAGSSSLRVRQQYHLRRGNWRQAEHWQHQVELDKLTTQGSIYHPSGVYVLACFYATVDNAEGMRECLAQMREYSDASEGLAMWERYMRAEYDRLRGCGELALPQYMELLDALAGEHQAWVYTAHGALRCLEQLGRFEQGKELGTRLLQQAEGLGIDSARGLFLRPLALIEAQLGNIERGVALSEDCIGQCRRLGMGGIILGMAYEFRARVAVHARDRAAFQQYVELCAAQFDAGGSSADLTARYDDLLSMARQAGMLSADWQARELGPVSLSNKHVEVRDRLADCVTPEARARYALQTLVSTAAAAGGHLYGLRAGQLTLLGSLADDPPEAAQTQLAAQLLDEALTDREANQLEPPTLTEAPDQTTATGTLSASVTAATERRPSWRAGMNSGMHYEVLFRSRDRGAAAVAALQPGPAPLRPLALGLMEVIADALAQASDTDIS